MAKHFTLILSNFSAATRNLKQCANWDDYKQRLETIYEKNKISILQAVQGDISPMGLAIQTDDGVMTLSTHSEMSYRWSYPRVCQDQNNVVPWCEEKDNDNHLRVSYFSTNDACNSITEIKSCGGLLQLSKDIVWSHSDNTVKFAGNRP